MGSEGPTGRSLAGSGPCSGRSPTAGGRPAGSAEPAGNPDRPNVTAQPTDSPFGESRESIALLAAVNALSAARPEVSNIDVENCCHD